MLIETMEISQLIGWNTETPTWILQKIMLQETYNNNNNNNNITRNDNNPVKTI